MSYTYQIRMAMIIFPFLFVLLLIPFLIWQYRKYGAVSLWRFIVTFSFVFYLLTAYFLIILPLPTKSYLHHLDVLHYQTYNLNPLAIFEDFFKNNPLITKGLSAWKSGLSDGSFIQPFFNILLTVPFGFFMRYYFGLRFRSTVIASFCLSLFFELTQLSALYGIYSRPYRLFDVDDLLLNTIGGMIGYSIVPIFRRLLPDLGKITQNSALKSHQVSFLRRAMSFIIDSLVFIILEFIISFFINNKNLDNLSFILSGIITFLIFPLIFGHATIGMNVLKIKYGKYDSDKLASPAQIILRNLIGYETVYLLLKIAGFIIDQINHSHNEEEITYLGFLLVISLPLLLIFVDGLFTLNVHHRTWYEKLSRTQIISSFIVKKSKKGV